MILLFYVLHQKKTFQPDEFGQRAEGLPTTNSEGSFATG